MEQMDNSFIGYVSGHFARTDGGLTGTEIDTLLDKYASIFDKGQLEHGGFSNKRAKMHHYLSYFSGPEQYQIIRELCNYGKFQSDSETTRILTKLQTTYNRFSSFPLQESELIQGTVHLLENYPEVRKLYDSAFAKFNQGMFERNILDDMRLALELLIKKLLSNNKSIENQLNELGKKLSEYGTPKEIRNMFSKLIDYYSAYQNDYVKHDDLVDKNDVEFVVEMTSVMMKYLISKLGE